MTVKSLRTPDDRFTHLPGWSYAPHYVDDLPGYDRLRMHYIDEGPKDGVVFLCIHGEPTWSYLFRKMAPVFLAADHRFIALDMFGFGRSDKPVDDDVYTYHFHRNALLAFVERFDLNNICLVVQDWGGLLGLTLPIEAPERYTRLLVMNTGLPVGNVAGKGFSDWINFNRAHPDLDIAGLMKRSTPVLSGAEAAAYAAPFPDQTYKAGVRRFPELVMMKESAEAELTPAASEGVATSQRAHSFWSNDWSGESFMAVGMQDPILGPPAMQYLHSLIKGCPPPMEVAEAGHFVQEWGGPIAESALKHFQIE